MRKPLVAGNWKMNGLRASLAEITAMGQALTPALRAKVDILVCPPATLLVAAATLAVGTGIAIGAQDCHENPPGAETGDIAARQLFDAGACAVIVGHSERRSDHGETDALVKAKAEAVIGEGMLAILCVGETRAEREAGKALAVVDAQLKGSLPESAAPDTLVIAYEPVWAIGTGLTPTLENIAEVHAGIRKALTRLISKDTAARMRILYGGSVKAANARDILMLRDVDGALVGGASLTAADFMPIVEAAA